MPTPLIPGVRQDDRVHGTGGRIYRCPDIAACDKHLTKLCATTGAARRANKVDIDRLLARRTALTATRTGAS